MLANADLRGAVLEFSDTGCNISIGTQTDDAEMVPAPGAVVEEMNQVKIVYGENTYFQISHSTMTGITLEDCRKEEVKKAVNALSVWGLPGGWYVFWLKG